MYITMLHSYLNYTLGSRVGNNFELINCLSVGNFNFVKCDHKFLCIYQDTVVY